MIQPFFSVVAPPPPLPKNPPRYVLPDVGTVSWDVGPFGHHDLFAGAAEWTRYIEHPMCAEGPIERFEEIAPRYGRHPAFHLLTSLSDPSVYVLENPFPSIFVERALPLAPEYYNGFRCAFPPASE